VQQIAAAREEERFAVPQLELERLELRELNLPLKHPFETSFGRTTNRRIFIVRVIDRDGAEGWGECVALEAPFFSGEAIDTAWIVIAKHVAPLLASQSVACAAEVRDRLSKVRGNQMAKGAVEAAIWDLEAKILRQPLWKHIGGAKEEITCGVSIGIQPSVETLLEKVRIELANGYQRIKIKIKPGFDVQFVEAVRSRYNDILLSVDANAAYSLERDFPVMKELDRYGLLMIEQPLRSGDLLDHSKLQKQIETPICLDESITTADDARQALELGACRVINIKLGRVGGFSEGKSIHDLARQAGIPVWCGGMLESGIGRAHNIALSTLPGFTLPGDVSASRRYWQEDIVDPPIEVSSRGTIRVPMGPGTGYSVNTKRLADSTVRFEEVALCAPRVQV
jgi:o-succinylbenzoate synthase